MSTLSASRSRIPSCAVAWRKTAVMSSAEEVDEVEQVDAAEEMDSMAPEVVPLLPPVVCWWWWIANNLEMANSDGVVRPRRACSDAEH